MSLEDAVRDLEIEPYDHLEGIVARAERLLATAERVGNASVALRCRLVRSDVAARSRQTHLGAQIARDVLQSAEVADDTLVRSRAHALLATCLWRIGERADSLEQAVIATDLLEASTPLHLRIDHLQIRALVACSFGAGPEGLGLFDEPLELCRGANLPILEVATLNNLAWFQFEHGLLAEADASCCRLGQVAHDHGLGLNLAIVDTIVNVRRALGEHSAAEQLLLDALYGPDPAKATEATAFAGTYFTLSAFQRDRGDLEAAEASLRRGLELAQDAKLVEVEVAILRELSAMEAERSDYEAAYAHLLACHVAWEHLKQAEAEVRTSTMHVLYGTKRALERVRAFEELAHTDPLTGLWNRRYLDVELPAIVDEASHRDRPFVVAFADIDHFKRVNDELSHDAGDAVLQICASLLRDAVGDMGTVVRMGGEEFLLVLDRCDARMGHQLVERACVLVREYDWSSHGVWSMTISIGIAESTRGITIPELLASADRHLYLAKSSGRDRVA